MKNSLVQLHKLQVTSTSYQLWNSHQHICTVTLNTTTRKHTEIQTYIEVLIRGIREQVIIGTWHNHDRLGQVLDRWVRLKLGLGLELLM